MSLDIHAYVTQDETWQEMIAIWGKCRERGFPPPPRVSEYFKDETPNGVNGILIDIRESIEQFKGLITSVHTIDLRKLPPYVDIIRIIES